MDIKFTFDYNINNSLQIGDNVYFCRTDMHGNFDTVDSANIAGTGIVRIGKCTAINRSIDRSDNTITVMVDPTLSMIQQSTVNLVDSTCFIMFSKSNEANLSSLLGYYAETTFVNDSPYEAELFAASTEFSQSSK